MHSVAVEELLCCEPIEAVHNLLFVEQEALQPAVERATACNTVLVQFIQLPDHCAQEIHHANTMNFLTFSAVSLLLFFRL